MNFAKGCQATSSLKSRTATASRRCTAFAQRPVGELTGTPSTAALKPSGKLVPMPRSKCVPDRFNVTIEASIPLGERRSTALNKSREHVIERSALSQELERAPL